MLVSMDNVKPYFYSKYTHISFPLTPLLNVHVATERACMESGWEKAHPYVCLLTKDTTIEHSLCCRLSSLHDVYSVQSLTGPEILNAICSAFGVSSSAKIWTVE